MFGQEIRRTLCGPTVKEGTARRSSLVAAVPRASDHLYRLILDAGGGGLQASRVLPLSTLIVWMRKLRSEKLIVFKKG